MRKLGAVAVIGLMRFRHIFLSPRTAAVGVLMGIFAFSVVQPFADFARQKGVPITPYAPPFVLSDQVCQMFLMLGAIALFAGAPYKDKLYPYALARAGKGAMISGNVLGMAMISVVYGAFLYGVMALPMLGNMTVSENWGKVWTTLAAYPDWVPHAYISIPEMVRNNFSPAGALLLGFLLEVGCILFLGMAVYLGNNLTSRPVGLWLGGGFVLLDITIHNLFPYAFSRFSPLTLARLSTYSGANTSTFNPPITYGFAFYAVGCAVAILLLRLDDGLRRDMIS